MQEEEVIRAEPEPAEYSNTSDSHAGPVELMTVSSRLEALQAIGTIGDQGEGFEHQETDDPSKAEYSHYFKFLRLQAQLEQYPDHVEQLAPFAGSTRPDYSDGYSE